MRVPVYDQQQVAPQQVGLPEYAPRAPSDRGLEAGLANLGHGVDRMRANVAHEEEKAIAAETTDAETQLTRGITEDLHGSQGTEGEAPAQQQGYLSLKGRDAEAGAAHFMERIEKRRQALAQNLKDERAKKLFLSRTGGAVESARVAIESHAARQRDVADVATLSARQDAAAEAMFQAARTGDGATVQLQSMALEGPIKALAVSPEDATRDIEAWRRKTVAVQLEGFLDVKRLDVAEALLTDSKEVLGPAMSKEYQARLDLAKKKQGGDGLALDLINGARKANGFVDTARVVESLQALPEDKRTPELEQSVSKWMQFENAKQKSVTDDYFNRALSSYLQRHSLSDVDPKDELWLRNPENEPEGWLKIEQIAKSHREGGPATGAQSRAMTEFLVDVADHPDRYATMSPGEFSRTWLSRFSRVDGERAGAVLAQMHTKAGKPEALSPVETKMLLQKGREAGVFDAKQNDVSKWSDDQAQNFYAAQEKLAVLMSNDKRLTGKPPDMAKVEGWVNELLLAGKDTEGGFMGFGGGTTRLEAEAQGKLGTYKPTWTIDEKAQAIEALRKKGARIDDAAIDRILRLKHKLPALPTQAAPAKQPNEVDPGRWGLDLSPAPTPEPKEPTGPGKY